MWKEERDTPEMQTQSGQDLRSVGITPGGLESDIETGQEIGQMEPAGQTGITGPGAAAGAAATPGGVMPNSAVGAPSV